MKTHIQMAAPCGIDCAHCYAHLRSKNTCPGCRIEGQGKPKSCQNCFKKQCADNRGISFCYECDEFPCTRIKRLDKRYEDKYNGGLIRNLELIREKGAGYFLDENRRRLTCPECRGRLSIHYGTCAECGKTFEIPPRKY